MEDTVSKVLSSGVGLAIAVYGFYWMIRATRRPIKNDSMGIAMFCALPIVCGIVIAVLPFMP